MELVGRGPIRVCYLGPDEKVADWVRAGFERFDEPVEFVAETAAAAALDRIADAQQRLHPRMRSPLVDHEDPFDCVICTDDGDPIEFIEGVREIHDELPIVLFARDGSEHLASQAISGGVDDYVTASGDNPTGRLVERVAELASDHRQARRTRRRNERTRRIVDENAEMITVVSPGASITYQNDVVEEVLGYTPAEIDEKLPFDSVHPDDWQTIREEFYDAVRDPEYVPTVEFRAKDADGQWRTVESRARNLLDDPFVQGFVITTRDVTERKERERDLEGYRTVVENAGDPMYVLTPEGEITWVNEAFIEHTGYDRDVVEDAHVSTFMREQDIEKGTEIISDLLENDDENWGRFEFVMENVSGEIRRYEDNVAVLTDDDGNLRGSVGVVRDVTSGEGE
ncbi:PAS domain S-box protein [Halorientalis brevis]|uniref:PAS domain S-box protein n=1 Tax=Halorientalis brevis TaxID=1126241 RepID=A0ABD6CI56_9EURY|nr:PAS domain S-box protein [Halorientalis brevis]